MYKVKGKIVYIEVLHFVTGSIVFTPCHPNILSPPLCFALVFLCPVINSTSCLRNLSLNMSINIKLKYRNQMEYFLIKYI